MSLATAPKTVVLRVDVPMCSFRPYESREYQDTHPFPPPSAVYGMLLSLCGIRREHKAQHQGVRMALAIEALPERGKVFRKFRRGKELNDLRPDYQDLLVDLKLWVWLRTAADQCEPPLVERISSALDQPQQVERSGGLSLGESSYLVDSISRRRADDDAVMHFLKPDIAGFYNLPVFVEHSVNRNNRRRFNIELLTVADAMDSCWIDIAPDRTDA